MRFSRSACYLMCLISLLWFPAMLLGAYRYVSESGSQTFPYDTWAKSARNIQDAVNAADPGDTILVSNGVYRGFGGHAEGTNNVVVIVKAIQVIGVNGSPLTVIDGGGTSRCAYVAASNAVLQGFTLKHGSGSDGGGLYAASNAVVRDCLVVSNYAENGGGAYLSGARLEDSEIAYNSTFYAGGGIMCWEPPFPGETWVRGCDVHHNVATLGGGDGGGGIFARRAIIENCLIRNNELFSEPTEGGGLLVNYDSSRVRNCVIRDNSAGRNGGGVFARYDVLFENCTIVSNTGRSGGGVATHDGALYRNCIIFDNLATLDIGSSNMYTTAASSADPVYEYCCLAPLTNGAGNISINPMLDYSVLTLPLHASSACIDAGTNQSWMGTATDIQGQVRVFNQRVDIGADEAVVECVGITSNNPVALSWNALIGAECQLQSSPAVTGVWANVGSPVTSTIYHVEFKDASATERQKFYRLLWLNK